MFCNRSSLQFDTFSKPLFGQGDALHKYITQAVNTAAGVSAPMEALLCVGMSVA